MSDYASTVFPSRGAQAEHDLGFGRLTDSLGRVLRSRLRQLRGIRTPLTHETIGILRDAARARDALWARTERARAFVGRPVF